jgi:hypothetical protein
MILAMPVTGDDPALQAADRLVDDLDEPRRTFLRLEQGGERAWLLTTMADAFFGHLRLATAVTASAPPASLATRQASSICISATLLSRRLA